MQTSAAVPVQQNRILLDSLNYAAWRQDVRGQLEILNLLPLIESDKQSIRRILTSAEGRKDDKKAMAIISSRLDESHLRRLEHCRSAYEMWFTLKSMQLDLFDEGQIQESLEDIIIDSDSDSNCGRCDSRSWQEYGPALALVKLRLQELNEQISKPSTSKLCQLCGSKKHKAIKCPPSTREIILASRRSSSSCVVL